MTMPLHLNAVPAEHLGLGLVAPFFGFLLVLACVPLWAPSFWEKWGGRVSVGWALVSSGVFTVAMGWEVFSFHLVKALVGEFLPFILVIAALYGLSSHITIELNFSATPERNVGVLAGGMLAASVLGTTGASAVLIRPLLHMNRHRFYKAHIVIFFIFLVANIGGCLSPLGDPPLFMGFLKGVSFWWPTLHMWKPLLLVAIPLLLSFWIIDRALYHRECAKGLLHSAQCVTEQQMDTPARAPAPAPVPALALAPVRVRGGGYFLGFAAVSGIMMGVSLWHTSGGIALGRFFWPLSCIVRECMLLGICIGTFVMHLRSERKGHTFSLAPIVEVATVFFCLFCVMIPIAEILHQGKHGALGALLEWIDASGPWRQSLYFWFSGLLSGVLDNTPTYLLFFHAAHLGEGIGDTLLLLAISSGSVFMGALTYIGNAPNLLVKTIAHEQGVAMPSFLGYALWALAFLFPLFALVTWVLF